MESPAAGSVVLVKFPFSDLSASKLRPAVVLAYAERDDWILCQITSNPYSDPNAVPIDESDFLSGNLRRKSYARPGKLFSANEALMQKVAGFLQDQKLNEVLDAVVAILKPNKYK
jgi:mRNA interferase MazF